MRLIDAYKLLEIFDDQDRYLRSLPDDENPHKKAKQDQLNWCINTVREQTIVPYDMKWNPECEDCKPESINECISCKKRCKYPSNCAECKHYDGTCLLSPKNWESWRLMEVRRPKWCPLTNNRTYDQNHSYDDEPRCKPILKNICKQYDQKDFFCGSCGSRVKFLQVRCEKCKQLINWEDKYLLEK